MFVPLYVNSHEALASAVSVTRRKASAYTACHPLLPFLTYSDLCMNIPEIAERVINIHTVRPFKYVVDNVLDEAKCGKR